MKCSNQFTISTKNIDINSKNIYEMFKSNFFSFYFNEIKYLQNSIRTFNETFMISAVINSNNYSFNYLHNKNQALNF